MRHDALARLDQLMQAYQGRVPGAAVLVQQAGAPLARRSYGFADLEHGIETCPATNFRLASVTKQFTAAAILLLAERARLRLDDGIGEWLPRLPGEARAVTLRHLLTHTSGLIDYEDLLPVARLTQLSDADVLALLERERRLYFAPGTAYRYSNGGYALLALVVARAAQQSFAAALRSLIFEPLGMQGTVAHQEGVSVVANRAYGYSEREGAWLITDQNLTSAVLGDGGIYSSVDDLAKWDAALDDERLLGRESLRQAFKPATLTDEADVAYGLGWRITGETVWHSGETIGFRNVIVRFAAHRFTVVVLTNRNEPPPYRLALAVAEIFRDSALRR